MFDKGFAERLEAVKNEKNLRQVQIAEMAGVRQATISGWLKGTIKSPGLETIKKLADALGVSAYWLLYGDNHTTTRDMEKDIVAVGDFSIDSTGAVAFKDIPTPDFCAAGAVLRNCKSFVMIGSHMEPVISDGDIVVIDTDDKTIKNGSIYAFFANGQFIVATLNRSISGQISASYSNPPQTEQINGKITIIGRAVKRLTDL